jgi:hypothetical protein
MTRAAALRVCHLSFSVMMNSTIRFSKGAMVMAELKADKMPDMSRMPKNAMMIERKRPHSVNGTISPDLNTKNTVGFENKKHQVKY